MSVTSYTEKALKGFTVVFAINIVAAFLGYMIRIVLARNLTVAEYGLFFAVFTLINFLSVFVGFGMSEALVKYIPEFLVKKRPDQIKNSVMITLAASLATITGIGLLLVLLANFLAKNYFKSDLAIPLIIAFILIMLFLNLRSILRCIFQAYQRMTTFSFIYLIENSLILIFLLCFFTIKKNIFTAAYSYTAAYILVFIAFGLFAIRVFDLFKRQGPIQKDLVRKLFSFGVPVMFSGIGGIIIVYTDTLILTYFRSMEEVGIYNVVVPTVMMLQFFATSIATVIFPMVSELWAKNKKEYITSGLKILYKYSLIIIIPASLIFIAFSKFALNLLFGIKYSGGALTMQILLAAVVFLGLHSITSTILSGLGHPAIGTKILLEGALINLVLNLAMIQSLGMVGAAISSLIAYAYVAVRCILKLNHFIPVEIPWMSWLKTMLAGLLMLGLIFLLKNIIILNVYLEAAICVSAGGLFYLAVAFILKIIDLKEIKDFASHFMAK